MDDALPNELHEAVANLGEHADCLSLRDALPLIHDAFEVSAAAELLDDVVVVIALHHVEEPDHILGLQTLQDLDFREERRPDVGVPVNCGRPKLYWSAWPGL